MSMNRSPAVVPDMNEAIRRMVERYQSIPKAQRTANLTREDNVREGMAATFYVACHS